MAWWSAFVSLGLDKYREQSDANKREKSALGDLEGLGHELSALNAEESGIALQLADRRRAREYKPIRTAPGRYQYLLRGGGGGFVQRSTKEGRRNGAGAV